MILDALSRLVPTSAAPLLAAIAAMSLSSVVLLVRRDRAEARRLEHRALEIDDEDRDADALDPLHDDAVTRTAAAVGRAAAPRTSSSLRDTLRAAGYHSPSAPTIFIGAKVLLFGLGLTLYAALMIVLEVGAGAGLFGAFAGAALFSFVPNLIVNARRRARRAEVSQRLPDAVDMLEICMSAGMGMDTAWNAVADEIRRLSPTFADEMQLTNLEIMLGVPRAQAMRHMAERTEAEDLSSLVALLVQSERFGASIVESLRTFARTMRETRSQRAEEQAEKMAVKLLFPMVGFIFPALLVVMVGPAAIELFTAIGSP